MVFASNQFFDLGRKLKPIPISSCNTRNISTVIQIRYLHCEVTIFPTKKSIFKLSTLRVQRYKPFILSVCKRLSRAFDNKFFLKKIRSTFYLICQGNWLLTLFLVYIFLETGNKTDLDWMRSDLRMSRNLNSPNTKTRIYLIIQKPALQN